MLWVYSVNFKNQNLYVRFGYWPPLISKQIQSNKIVV